MKKSIIFLVCLAVCGCKNDAFQASDFSWDSKSKYLNYAVGSVKNTSSKNCELLKINLEYSSGNIIEEETCYVNEIIEAGKTFDVECYHAGENNNISSYKIRVKNVECSIWDN